MSRGRRYISSEGPGNAGYGRGLGVPPCGFCPTLQMQVNDLQNQLRNAYEDLNQAYINRDNALRDVQNAKTLLANLEKEKITMRLELKERALKREYDSANKVVSSIPETLAGINGKPNHNVLAKLEAKIKAKKDEQKDKELIEKLQTQLQEEKEKNEKLKNALVFENDRVNISQALNGRFRNVFKSFAEAAVLNFEEMDDQVTHWTQLNLSHDQDDINAGADCNELLSPISELTGNNGKNTGPSNVLIDAINMISPEELRELQNIDFEDINYN